MGILGLNFNWKLLAGVQDILALIDGPESCRVHNLAGRLAGSIPKPYNPLNTVSDAGKIMKSIMGVGGGGGVFF
jgi:hypothetical protein